MPNPDPYDTFDYRHNVLCAAVELVNNAYQTSIERAWVYRQEDLQRLVDAVLAGREHAVFVIEGVHGPEALKP